MTGKHLVYYISGHGFGHARRSAEIARELLARDSQLTIHLRTTAPAAIFEDLLSPRARLSPIALDPGAIEDDTLTISPQRTADAARKAIANRDGIVASEASFIRSNGIAMILADIPFLAGDIAAAAGVPAVGVSNFTWDWIFQPLLTRDPHAADLLGEIHKSYGKMRRILRIPFGGVSDAFAQVIDVPLVVRRGRRPRDEIVRHLQLDAADRRPRILVAQRGGTAADVLLLAARQAPDLLFLCPHEVPTPTPENLLHAALGPSLTFTDLVRISDVVLSKLGYGILADCIAAGAALLWPPRTGFREDAVALQEASPFLRMRPVSVADYRAGNWGADLRALLQQPPPTATCPLDGAAVCANIIAGWL